MPFDQINGEPIPPKTPCIDFARAVAREIRQTDMFTLRSWCGCNLGIAAKVHWNETQEFPWPDAGLEEQREAVLARLGFPHLETSSPYGTFRVIQGGGLDMATDSHSDGRREQCARMFERLAETGIVSWTERLYSSDRLLTGDEKSQGILKELAALKAYEEQMELLAV